MCFTQEVTKGAIFIFKNNPALKSSRYPCRLCAYQIHLNLMLKVPKHTNPPSKLCELYGFKPVICYLFDNLNDNNYTTETQQIMDLRQFLTKRNKYNNAFGDYRIG